MNLPRHTLTKYKWAAYFVKHGIMELNEQECYKQVFYGFDKVGLDMN